jgi:hypothetical protein
MHLKIEASAWRAIWTWSLRPALAVSFFLSAVAIFQILSGRGLRTDETYLLVTTPIVVGALGLSFWLLKMVFDFLKFGAMLAIAYAIVQISKITANRKATKAHARLDYTQTRR